MGVGVTAMLSTNDTSLMFLILKSMLWLPSASASSVTKLAAMGSGVPAGTLMPSAANCSRTFS